MSKATTAAYNKGYLAGKKSATNGNGNGNHAAAPAVVAPKVPLELTIRRPQLEISIKETPA